MGHRASTVDVIEFPGLEHRETWGTRLKRKFPLTYLRASSKILSPCLSCPSRLVVGFQQFYFDISIHPVVLPFETNFHGRFFHLQSLLRLLRKRYVLRKKLSLAAITLLLALCGLSQAQTLTRLTNQPPDGAGIDFLLTDGTVLAQGNQGQDWWKLTPDVNGSYVNGTWSQVASLASNYDPDAFASATLADGRVLIEGGEYNFGSFTLTNLGAVYDPKLNTWTPLDPPPGWDYIGDSPSTVLPNGHFLIGRKLDMQMAELDPATLEWTAMGSSGKADFNAEEGWTLMPDGSVLTVDVLNNPNSERYVPALQHWTSLGSTMANLQGPPEEGCIPYGGGQYCPPGEVGPAILRPDGSVFATGARHLGASTGHTAIYLPWDSIDCPRRNGFPRLLASRPRLSQWRRCRG